MRCSLGGKIRLWSWTSAVFLTAAWTFLLLSAPVVAQDSLEQGSEEIRTLGHPGYLIIGAARDTSAGFRWIEGPGPDQISLNWRDGLLTIPDSLVLEPFAEFDLAIPVTADLSGAGASGNLLWQEGAFSVSEPVMITDGVIQFLVSEGEIEVIGSRIRYRAPAPTESKPHADPRASFMMLAGILLLIWILMRRARKQLKART